MDVGMDRRMNGETEEQECLVAVLPMVDSTSLTAQDF